MRKLMWTTIGFCAACGVCTYGMKTFWIFPSALVAIAVSVLVFLMVRKKPLMQKAIAVLTGFLLGLAWFCVYQLAYLGRVTALDGEEINLAITSAGYSRVTDYGAVLEGKTEINGRSYQLWVYLSEQIPVEPGDAVTGRFRIRLTTPGGMRESAVFQGKGIFLVADQRDEITLLKPEKVPFQYQPALLAGKIKGILEILFPKDVSAFTKALLLGDTWDLDWELDTAFKISGIRHIVAVSGLHIAIVYSLVCIVTLRRRFLTAVFGIPVLILFAAVAGFTPSALRACIMLCLMQLALVLNREYDPPSALAFSVLVMLLVNPLAVVSASLQLSVSCVAGILLFHIPIQKWLMKKLTGGKHGLGRLWTAVSSSVSISISAMIFTTPLCAYYFGMVSLIGVLTNLLTLCVVNLIFYGLAVTMLLYLISPAAGGFLAGLLAWPIRYVQWLALTFADFPLAAVYTKSVYIVIWLVFLYILLAFFLGTGKKHPETMLCCGLLGLCIALLASWAEPLLDDTRITMLDVGQGQAILLQSEEKTFLVDCGGDSDTETADMILQTLLSQGISHLDGIILTHYDRDHAGALPYLLERMDLDFLFLPDTRNTMAPVGTEGKTVYVWNDLELRFGEVTLSIYGPVYSGMDNENSLCVLFDTKNCDILITGDRSAFGERMLLRRQKLPDVDVLVAGHHGAADSSSEELLRAVTPETVLISVAQDNLYSHPSPALLQRLEKFGCSVYRTDLHGTIVIRR